MASTRDDAKIARFADMLAALGTETRLKIVRLLLSAHPEGMVVGEILDDLHSGVGHVGDAHRG